MLLSIIFCIAAFATLCGLAMSVQSVGVSSITEMGADIRKDKIAILMTVFTLLSITVGVWSYSA